MQKLVHDLRKTLVNTYDTILDRLLSFLPRPLSPAALTALLTVLSSVLKYLLEPERLTSTWDKVANTLESCKPEVQRAIGEVWATVLRRFKKEERETCVRMMLSTSEYAGMDDMIAWSFVFAIRVSHSTL